MTLFRPLTSSADLPVVGSVVESVVMDIKEKVEVSRANHVELAKDIAAFANSTGGVILCGACEDTKRGTLGIYKPYPGEADTKAVVEAFNTAAADFCSPRPFVDTSVVEHLDGGFVVAVNVWPFPAQAIGVRQARIGNTMSGSFLFASGSTPATSPRSNSPC